MFSLMKKGKKADAQRGYEIACKEWMDVRSFGQVFAFKGSELSLGIRGPVSVQPAFSVDQKDITIIKKTKSVNSEDKEGKSSDTMGMKHRVDFGVYILKGSINVQLSEKTGFTEEDAEKIKEALSFGDLSENSEYDEAKNDQAILEARIADLEVMVSNARVIEKENLAADTVHIGSSVFVKTKRADGSEAERSFSIVGSNEANPRQGKISDESAVGKALVGAKVGQTVEVETPAGIVEYTIISVS